MPFYQTNPPFSGWFFGVLGSVTDGYNCERQVFSVGSFWKTNPPGHHKRGCFEGVVGSATTSRHLVRLGLENEPTGAPQERPFQRRRAGFWVRFCQNGVGNRRTT